MTTHSRPDHLNRQRYLDDILFIENVASMSTVLANFDIPVRPTIRERRYVDDQEVPSEPMDPGRLGDMPVELPLCVDVKDEAATRRQVPPHPNEYFLPIGEAPNVINRIE